jgi:mono/diheme cytochrome c family protein
VKTGKTVIRYWLAALPLLAAGGEDFISYFEYGGMLYENPRGVTCKKCHGTRGEGKEIARYKDAKGRVRILRAPAIAKLDFVRFYRPFTSQGHKRTDVMPTYFLTKKEIRAIYDYLRTVNQAYSKGKRP